MIKHLLTVIILFLPLSASAQIVLRAGMGIHFQSTPSLNEYINQNFAASFEQRAEFNSAIVFSAEGGYLVSETYEISAELAYLIDSYTFNSVLGRYEFFYGVFMPSLLNYYVISGAGYQIKFGGGAGLRFAAVEETLPGTVSAVKYNSTGVGLILRADGNTLLGGNFYANIGGDIRYDLTGEPKDNNDVYIEYNNRRERVNLNAFSFGLRLGLTFIF